jgi:crotonobetainyl-CoA:carnitine CoA-transferase CaiB-like acyl-CoA transferase
VHAAPGADAHAARAPGDPQRGRAGRAVRARAGLPFAPIRKPEELFDDEHLQATGGLAEITLPDGARAGQTARSTLLPFTMDGQRLGVRLQPPHQGEHTTELLAALGYDGAAIEALRALRAIG